MSRATTTDFRRGQSDGQGGSPFARTQSDRSRVATHVPLEHDSGRGEVQIDRRSSRSTGGTMADAGQDTGAAGLAPPPMCVGPENAPQKKLRAWQVPSAFNVAPPSSQTGALAAPKETASSPVV